MNFRNGKHKDDLTKDSKTSFQINGTFFTFVSRCMHEYVYRSITHSKISWKEKIKLYNEAE